MNNISLILSTLLFLLSRANGSPPDWYVNGGHPRYVSEFYFVGVGSGESYDIALTEAQGQVARQIEVQIESEITNLISSHTVDDQESIVSDYRSTTKSIADASLRGLEIGFKQAEGSTHYVLVVLDKSSYANELEVDLNRMRQEIADKYHRGYEILRTGRLIPALRELLDLEKITENFLATAAIYNAISMHSYQTEDVLTGPALMGEIRVILSNVRLDIVSGDKQSGKSGLALAAPLVVSVRYGESRTNTSPLEGVTLSLNDSEGSVVDKIATDTEGKASFRLNASGSGFGRAVVSINLTDLPSRFRRDLKGIEAVFTYNAITLGPYAFAVEIVDENGRRLPKVEQKISGAVVNLGHRIDSNSALLLAGVFEPAETHQVESMGGTMYTVKSELHLFLRDKRRDEDLSEVLLVGQGLDKISESKANEKSYNNVKLSQSDMSRLLGQGGEKLSEIGYEQSRQALEMARKQIQNGNLKGAVETLSCVVEGENLIKERNKLVDELEKKLKSD